MRKLFVLLFLPMLISCSSKPTTVNPPASPAWTQIGNGHRGHDRLKNDGEMVQEGLRVPNTAAIAGTLLLEGVVPTPLNGVTIQLSHLQAERWAVLTDVQTSGDGRFAFTRSLSAGNYRLKVIDSRFQGEWNLELQGSPQLNLYFEARRIPGK